MTADATALVRAVLESPADDAPRLVFADYVEEQGDPARAEFIRLQVALAREPCPNTWVPPRDGCTAPDCRSCRLFRDRVHGLFQTPGFGGWVWGGWEAPVANVWFDRGFIERVAVVAERFTEVAGRLFSLEPIRSVRLTGRMPALTPGGAVWYSEGQVGLSATARTAAIPKAVYELMRSPLVPRPAGRWETQVYPTHTDANDALSEACVRFGRREAGLSAK
jgi:uncharacterized protein (TIGR02996 family)